jgi:hypothetical protein
MNLPEALLFLQLSTWLTLKDVARVDSAMCSSAIREEFLSASQHVTLQSPRKYSNSCDAMNVWIFRKGVSVDGLYATKNFVGDDAVRQVYLERFGHGCCG